MPAGLCAIPTFPAQTPLCCVTSVLNHLGGEIVMPESTSKQWVGVDAAIFTPSLLPHTHSPMTLIYHNVWEPLPPSAPAPVTFLFCLYQLSFSFSQFFRIVLTLEKVFLLNPGSFPFQQVYLILSQMGLSSKLLLFPHSLLPRAIYVE